MSEIRNKDIIKTLKVTALLLDLHDENQFKIRSWENAAIFLERVQKPLVQMDAKEIAAIEGVGKTIAGAIVQLIEKGSFDLLEELTQKTPKGLLELTDIKGIGAKKIRQIWKELNIDTVEGLLDACHKGSIAQLKGFGAKTQENMISLLEFTIAQRGKLRYADAEILANALMHQLQKQFPQAQLEWVGEYRRRCEVISVLELLAIKTLRRDIITFLKSIDSLEYNAQESGPFTYTGRDKQCGLLIVVHFSDEAKYYNNLLLYTGSATHLEGISNNGETLMEVIMKETLEQESEAYEKLGLPYIIPELREGKNELQWAKNGTMPKLLEYQDFKGLIHAHSTYSDGQHSLKAMAEACKALNFEYLGISDHSRSAFYARGLELEKIQEQHREIDVLNNSLEPFVIFKGIESDILSDGSLDYDEATLQSFDFVIASIHSNLNMNREKATKRLLNAIANPYTTILGHPTSRLLLKREGYPIDHKTIIDACAHYNVIIEINANPWRLELDWRWIQYALEKGVLLSVNPDAHQISGIEDMKYGLHVARKGGLDARNTLNTWSAIEVKKYFENRKQKISHG
ncbi:MAG: DNA polymerase/3'-5' exonuclease PolX [Cyclobacteriaceae bacterium]